MPRLPRMRRRRPTIRRQLLATVLIPSISLLAVALGVTGYLAYNAQQTSSLENTVRNASAPSGAAILGLQEERSLTVDQLADHSATSAQLQQARSQVNVALAQVVAFVQPLVAKNPDATAVQRQLGGLTGRDSQLQRLRAAVDVGQVSVPTAYFAYSQMIAAFGASLRSATKQAPDAQSAYEELTSVDLFNAVEALSRSNSVAQVAMTTGKLPAELAGDFAQQTGAYHAELASVAVTLPTAERAQLNAIMASDDWNTLTLVETALSRTLATGRPTPARQWMPVSEQQWQGSMTRVVQSVSELYARQAANAAARGAATVHRALVRAWIIGAGLLLIGISVVIIAIRLSRRLARRLLNLRDDTLALSETQLPGLVERLRQGDDVDVRTSSIPPQKHGGDEIGQVAMAFNAAQQLALQAAANEAAGRTGTRQVFLNIARRSQMIAYQQLNILDRAEVSQKDPQQLSLLFELDHLATRARRNAENLVILSGRLPGRRWSEPVPLVDIVRGAASETERYSQVVTGFLPGRSVMSDRVADVIHILAELIDNATTFAPPTSTVEIRGKVVGLGVLLEIEDQGLGMGEDDREQLNQMLRKVPDFSDLALSNDSRLGLFVVGQLAVRHKIRVTLRESLASGGTCAVVLLPHRILAAVPEFPDEASVKAPSTASTKAVDQHSVRAGTAATTSSTTAPTGQTTRERPSKARSQFKSVEFGPSDSTNHDPYETGRPGWHNGTPDPETR